MAFIQMSMFSEAMGKCVQVNVIMPQNSTNGQIGMENNSSGGNYKTLYLLHGLSDDNTIWMRRTSIERYAAKYGIAVVMPNGDKSFYTNMVHGDRYYDYIAHELPNIIENMFPVSRKREDRFVAGLSMGGYGALKIALREETFACAAALSPVGDIKKRSEFWVELFKSIFGEERNIPDNDDLYWLVKNCKTRPRLFMAIGTEDFLYHDNQPLKDAIVRENYDFKYLEGPGTHCWEFWDEYIQYALEWMFEKA